MKKIVFTAAPNKSSFTFDITKNLVDKYWDDIEIINLYDKEYKLGFLEFEDKKNISISNKVTKIQSKILESEEIIFIFPIWWWGVPAIMKNFIDNVFVSWFAFEYWKDWKKELLSDKYWKVIATCDAPSNIYLENSDWTWINLKTYFEKSIFWFCWIKSNWVLILWDMRLKSEEERKNILTMI